MYIRPREIVENWVVYDEKEREREREIERERQTERERERVLHGHIIPIHCRLITFMH